MMEEDLMMHLKNRSVCKLKVSKLAFYLALFFFLTLIIFWPICNVFFGG